MISMRTLLLLCLCGLASAAQVQQNPVSRVVELMRGLSKTITEDGKTEQELFDKYVCWYKTIVSTKKSSNAKASDRIEAVGAYIADVQSGRVELTSERKDLEKEIEKLNTEVDSSEALRKREKDDYYAAKAEMEKSISALEGAVQELGESNKAGALTSVGFDLRRVVQIGQHFLGKEDMRYLENTLDNGDAPETDAKNLNKDNSHNKKYNARSPKIKEILNDMLQTFRDNLADAEKKEFETRNMFEALTVSKQSQLSAAQEALSSGDAEGASRFTSKEEAQGEVDALTTQVASDEKFITEAEDAYAIKVTEWKERKRLQTGEVAAISKAINVLTSDEARDLMSSSFKSQSMFLQDSAESQEMQRRVAKAALSLRDLAVKHNDMRLAAFAVSVRFGAATKGRFDKVTTSIDQLVSDLNAESDEDLRKKETCEMDRMENSKKAKLTSQKMDDQSALIKRHQATIEEKQKEVDENKAYVKELKLQMEEAKVMRNSEKLEYQKAKQTDEQAAQTIQRAADVLKKFYEDEGLSLVVTEAKVRVVRESPGEAPPPPPSTFSKPYGGAKGESSGIQSILEMVKADIEKDIRVATAEEEKAAANFVSFNSETESMISNLESERVNLEGEIGDSEDKIATAKKEHTEKKAFLDQTLTVLSSIAPGCDFMAVNFEVRKKNREAEIDGLYEAKASLQGGSFKQ